MEETEEGVEEEEENRYQTRQAGKSHDIVSVEDVVEWTVPGLPVLTLPLAICKGGKGETIAISLLQEEEELPAQGPFTIFCSSSCYITLQEEQCLLLWKWEEMRWMTDDFQNIPPYLDSDSDECSSEEEGDDVVDLLDDEEDEAIEGTHTAAFKVLGVTSKIVRQDHLYAAKIHMADGKNVEAVLQQEPSNVFDPNAIQVVVGVGDSIRCVGYIPNELTKYVNPAIQGKKITSVQIQHITFRAFNPPGYYMRLLVTKRGRWNNEVIRKSIHAK